VAVAGFGVGKLGVSVKVSGVAAAGRGTVGVVAATGIEVSAGSRLQAVIRVAMIKATDTVIRCLDIFGSCSSAGMSKAE
jgi:hypothetical protein